MIGAAGVGLRVDSAQIAEGGHDAERGSDDVTE